MLQMELREYGMVLCSGNLWLLVAVPPKSYLCSDRQDDLCRVAFLNDVLAKHLSPPNPTIYHHEPKVSPSYLSTLWCLWQIWRKWYQQPLRLEPHPGVGRYYKQVRPRFRHIPPCWDRFLLQHLLDRMVVDCSSTSLD